MKIKFAVDATRVPFFERARLSGKLTIVREGQGFVKEIEYALRPQYVWVTLDEEKPEITVVKLPRIPPLEFGYTGGLCFDLPTIAKGFEG